MEAGVFRRALGWLRAGYPEGLPRGDYVALFGLLARRLTKAEVGEVADQLIFAGILSATREEIGAMIEQVFLTPPLPEDVNRVAAHLAAGGWPLELG